VDLGPADVGIGDEVGNRVRDDYRAAELLRPAGEIDGMQPEDVVDPVAGYLLGLGVQVEGIRAGIDHGGSRYANRRRDAAVPPDVAAGDRGNDRSGPSGEETILPKHGSVVRVDGVKAVLFGGHENDVVLALARPHGDVDVGNVKRLGVDLAIHRSRADLAERRGRDVGRRKERFVQILAGAAIVIVELQDAHRGHQAPFQLFQG
jgi:hypothetical protein